MPKNSDYVLIMYHHSCTDGTFAAAIAALAEFPKKIVYLPLCYSKDNGPILMKDAEGNTIQVENSVEVAGASKILIVDFSLREDQLADITSLFLEQNKSVNEIRVYDHHDVRSVERYEEECLCRQEFVDKSGTLLPVRVSKELTFTSGCSGTLITLMESLLGIQKNMSHNYRTIAKVAQLVSDRDTWKREKKDAFAFYDGTSGIIFDEVEEAGVSHDGHPKTTVSKARDILMEPAETIDKFIADGYDKQRAVNSEIRLILKDAVICEANAIVPVRHLVFTAHRGITSEACAQYLESEEAAANQVGVVMVVRLYKSAIAVSVRSKVNHESDTTVMAEVDDSMLELFKKKYPNIEMPEVWKGQTSIEVPSHIYGAKSAAIRNGGNGHQEAAGFSISVDNFLDTYGHPLKEMFKL